jgi:hypothetical protein
MSASLHSSSAADDGGDQRDARLDFERLPKYTTF